MNGSVEISRHYRGVLLFVVGLCLMGAVNADEHPVELTGGEVAKPPIDENHPLFRPLQLAYQSREALKELKGYEAVFTKQEVIDRRRRSTTMKLKLREEPFSVYLYFLDPNKGREVIYVEGKNNNMLMVHETGVKALAGTVSLDPKSKDAMAENKYPVTMIGMRTMLERVIAQWEDEGKYAETTVQYYQDAKLGNVPCLVIESSHPRPRDNFKFHMTRLYLQKETWYPVRVEQYGFPGKGDKQPPLLEEYTYSQIKPNPDLTDQDFDHTNPSYAFPK